MPILSAQDRAFWEANGYVVVPEAVPPEKLKAVVDAIWEFLGMDPNDSEDWYREPHSKGGMVEVYQHQALWDNRQYPRVHEVFSEIWGTERLWVSFDRANMKPPVRPDRPEWDHEQAVHWDLDTAAQPIPFKVQGVLYLTDTPEDRGGFRCVPGFHRQFEAWVKTQPADRNTRRPDMTGLELRKVPGRAGDLVIWHSLLPHANGRNTSDAPRLAQYITMFPSRERDEEERGRRIRAWQERLPPIGSAFPGDPRGVEQKHGKTAALTGLGKRLLGLDLWGPAEAGGAKG